MASAENPPVIEPGHSYASVTDKISSIVLTRRTPRGWMIGFGISLVLFMLFNYAVTFLLVKGVGIWGINIPVGWGFAIVNFVWWIGIGHAGTLISAILLLLKQQWRTSINRFAEAMTLFAVACAGMFPAAAHGTSVAFLLAYPVPKHDVPLAAIPQPAGLGRVCGFHIRDGFAAFLVCRADSRSSDAARPRAQPLRESDLWLSGDGLARIGGTLVAIRNGFAAAGGIGDTLGRFRPHGGEL